MGLVKKIAFCFSTLFFFFSTLCKLFQIFFGFTLLFVNSIGTDQLDWYRDKSNQFKKQNNRTIPGLVFTHIPLPEFMSLYNFHDTFGDNGEGMLKLNLNFEKSVI